MICFDTPAPWNCQWPLMNRYQCYGAPFVNLLFRPNLCHFPLIYKQLKMPENLFINQTKELAR